MSPWNPQCPNHKLEAPTPPEPPAKKVQPPAKTVKRPPKKVEPEPVLVDSDDEDMLSPPALPATPPVQPPVQPPVLPEPEYEPDLPPPPPAPLPFDDAPYLRVYTTKEEMRPYTKEGKPTKYSINKIVYAKDVKCVAVLSGMGSGKSHASVELIEEMHGAAKELIKELRAAKPGGRLRILIITARVPQAFSTMANVEEMGASIYSDEKLKGGLLVVEDFMV